MKKFCLLIILILFSSPLVTAQGCCEGNGCNTPPATPSINTSTGGGSEVLGSIDPNDLIPPDAIGDKGWIRRDKDLPFTLLFENLPAQRVEVITSLGPNVNTTSFEFVLVI